MLLPASYWRNGGIAHAYATTVHKAQGSTLDTTHLLLTDDAYHEITYVMLSRDRHRLSVHGTALAPAEGLHATAIDHSTEPDGHLDRAMHRQRHKDVALRAFAAERPGG